MSLLRVQNDVKGNYSELSIYNSYIAKIEDIIERYNILDRLDPLCELSNCDIDEFDELYNCYIELMRDNPDHELANYIVGQLDEINAPSYYVYSDVYNVLSIAQINDLTYIIDNLLFELRGVTVV